MRINATYITRDAKISRSKLLKGIPVDLHAVSKGMGANLWLKEQKGLSPPYNSMYRMSFNGSGTMLSTDNGQLLNKTDLLEYAKLFKELASRLS